jgi:hypothetical protein
MRKCKYLLFAEQSMTKLHKIYWVLNNLSNALAPAITIGYWATVYNPGKTYD